MVPIRSVGMGLEHGARRHFADSAATGVIALAGGHWKSAPGRLGRRESVSYCREVAFTICHPYHGRMDFKEVQLSLWPVARAACDAGTVRGPCESSCVQ